MPVTGQLIIGFDRVTTASTFHGSDPARGAPIEPAFSIAGRIEVERACALAQGAFEDYRHLSLARRALFLETCADRIMGLADVLLGRAGEETGLPRARLETERGRTAAQLRLFAQVVRQGDWLGLRIDSAQPERKPLPRADLRLRRIPLGPVVVFGASNFPLAFSAAGGDVAAALAAGCPVIVKAHPSHPGTSELAAAAISDAAQECGLPNGVYSHLSGPANDLGSALVTDPRIKAVGFTGSRAGGLALMKLAAARPEPIPVYAEMSSINPVVLLPAALRMRAETIAAGFVTSLTMGAGQFCTNPGLVLAIEGPDLDRFIAAAAATLAKTAPAQMLSSSICANYQQGVARLRAQAEVVHLATGMPAAAGSLSTSALFQVEARHFIGARELSAEVFGPSSLIVRCRDVAELAKVLEALEGQLTATLHLETQDHPAAARLLPILELKAGRILVNGWPTGVEVCHAMVHGGPYPATSDARVTSVGTLAIERFLRPVCYQDFPQELLPPELRNVESARLPRLLDGKHIAP
jgi:alpha-ketoglutaric semialdehyde dehydrogenase